MAKQPDPAEEQSLRAGFADELDQLRLQLEVLAVRVGDALNRMRTVLNTGDAETAEAALAADDDIDAMVVSLTERCYDLLRLQAPVASDLRFIVSVIRLLEELERIGDLSLRVVKQADMLPLDPGLSDTVSEMAAVAQGLFKTAIAAWSKQDLDLACTLATRNRVMDSHYGTLMQKVLALEGPGAAQRAVTAVLVGRALERIADHTVIVGERLRYMITADPAYLASEIR
ncbi:MAG: phosphate signaling complex protein PhoU [Actinomycetota bacterium]